MGYVDADGLWVYEESDNPTTDAEYGGTFSGMLTRGARQVPEQVTRALARDSTIVAAAVEAVSHSLPTDLKFPTSASFNKPPAAQSNNSQGNGERMIPWATVSADGVLSEVQLRVRNPNGLASFRIRITAGALSGRDAGSEYTVRAASAIITVPAPANGAVVTVPVGLAVRTGEYIGLEIESGVNVGYTVNSTPGFSYTANRGADVFATAAGGKYTISQALTGNNLGFGYTVESSVTKPVAARADLTALTGRVGEVEATAVRTVGGVLPASILPPELKDTGSQAVGIPAVATSNVNANGERFVSYAPATGDGKVTSVQLLVRQNAGALASFNVRVTVGSLTEKAAGGVYTVRAASAIIAVNAPAVGATVDVPVGLDIRAGEYVALEVQSGIGIGYVNNAAGNVGFGYRYSLGANVFAIAAGGTYTVQQSFGANTRPGFGFTLAISTLRQVATKAALDALAASVLPPFAGKKIVAIGDSMVRGHTVPIAQGWLALIAARLGASYVNYGINGTFLTNRLYNDQQGVVDRYTGMVDDADYVLVFAGTNDANAGVTPGAANSTNPAEFNGALNVLIPGLITKYPTKKLGFITPYRRNANYPAYVDAIKARCAEHGVPVFDNVANGGVDWTNAAQRAAITLDDTYHLNPAGMAYVSTKYEAFIRAL